LGDLGMDKKNNITKVVGRTNRLLSFDMTWTGIKNGKIKVGT
jgi:hypothetical protein